MFFCGNLFTYIFCVKFALSFSFTLFLRIKLQYIINHPNQSKSGGDCAIMFRQVVISSTRSKSNAPYTSSIGRNQNESRVDSEVMSGTSADPFRSWSSSAAFRRLKMKRNSQRRPWTTIAQDEDRIISLPIRSSTAASSAGISPAPFVLTKDDKENKKSQINISAVQVETSMQSKYEFDVKSMCDNEDQVAIGRLRKINVHQRLRNLRSAFAQRAEQAQQDFTARLTAPPPESDEDGEPSDDLAKPLKHLPVEPERLQQLLNGRIPFEQLLDQWAEEDFLCQVDPCKNDTYGTAAIDSKAATGDSKASAKRDEEQSEDEDGEDDDEDEDKADWNEHEFELNDAIWTKIKTPRDSSSFRCLASDCIRFAYRCMRSGQVPTVNPQGAVHVCWLLLISIAFVYNAIFIPYRIVFESKSTSNDALFDVAGWQTLDSLADLFYTLHVFVWQPHKKFVKNGLWVHQATATRHRYFGSRSFWLDLISWAPFDWVAGLLLTKEFGLNPFVFRLNRLMQVITFWCLFDRLDSRASWPHLVRIGRTLFHMAYLVHVNACAYYGLSAWLGIGSDRWVYNGQGRAYLRCFYFALRTATSISGKMPRPERDSQRLYMALAWLLGVFVFAFLIGQIRDIVGQANRQHAMYRNMADRIALLLRHLRVPNTLRLRAASWLAFTWKEQHTLDEQQIVALLPSKCRLDIALAEHLHVLRRVRLFRGCDRSAMRELLLRLRPAQYLPGDYVFKFGEPALHMYIVGSGQLHVCADSGQFLATLESGNVFGELAVLQLPSGCNRRTASVRAVGFCTLFALSKFDLWDTLSGYPDTERLLRRRARRLFHKRKAATLRQLAQHTSTRIDRISEVVRAESVISSAPKLSAIERNRLANTVELVLNMIRSKTRSDSHFN